MTSPSIQFPRTANLLLTSTNLVTQVRPALDLSNLRFTFQIKSSDNETPNTADIRVYNLSDQTERQATAEFDSVVIQAGYGENVGVIFRGTIKQRKIGKESNVDKYLDLMAADGDEPYNFGLVNQSIAAGSTPGFRLSLLGDALGLPVDPNAFQGLTGGILPRGRVLWGLAKLRLRELALSQDARWSIQQGVVKLLPLTGVPSGVAIKVNSITGMVGQPEATDNGIEVEMLLNPLVRVGTSLQINNKDIQQTQVVNQGFPGYRDLTFVARTTEDGIYRVLAVEHRGDTRGQEFYTVATCLSLSQSGQVLAFG